MRRFSCFLLLWLALSAIGEEPKAKYRIISMISLIANPSKANGGLVQTEGFFRFEHRGFWIYLDEVSAKNVLLLNALPVEIGKERVLKAEEKYNNQYVAVRGRFVAYDSEKVVSAVGYLKDVEVVLKNEYFEE